MVYRYILERMAINAECPFHIFNDKGEILFQCGVRPIGDPFLLDATLYFYMKNEMNLQAYPLLIFEDKCFIYGAFYDKEENLYVCGPVALETVNKTILHRYQSKHKMEGAPLELVKKSVIEMANILAILFYAITGEELTEDQIIKQEIEEQDSGLTDWEMVQYHIDRTDNDFQYLNYEKEKEILNHIRLGNFQAFREFGEEEINMVKHIGKLANSNMKQWEYMAVTGISLATRAAIDGGIRPLNAYKISDLYLQRLERCQNVIEIMGIIHTMQRDFAERVHQEKSRKRSAHYIEQCKDIIGENFHHDISVTEIAEKIGINRSYLSRKFAEQEGMSISRYMMKIRLEAAENMLKYSDATIQQISEYLNFSSQSYFGSMFREKNGISPYTYRQKNKLIDFKMTET